MDSHPLKQADSLGPLIKAWRQSRGLSQSALGKQLGISQVRVATIEAHAGKVSLDQMIKLLAALGKGFVIQDVPAVIVQATGHAAGTSRVQAEGCAIHSPGGGSSDKGDQSW